jgi:RimJ/RimL family protein N-acetyltransferase
MHNSGNFGLIITEKDKIKGKYSIYLSSEGNVVKSGIDKGINICYKISIQIIKEIMERKEEYKKSPWKLIRYFPTLLWSLLIKERTFYYGVLKGKKVFLRPSVDSDMGYLMEWYNDYELNKLAGWTYSKVTESNLKHNYSKSYGYDPMNLIIDNEDGKPIGTIQLYDFSHIDKTCKLGIRIGDKSHWGKAYGEDAVNTILEYAFMQLDINRVSLRVYEYNERAARCYLKCGFENEGRSRKSALIDGKYYDEILMGILKSDFIEVNSLRS